MRTPLPHDARAVANFLLDLAADSAVPLSHLKLQKILYNAHGYHLAWLDRPLFFQDVQAWKYGPVVPSVYTVFKDYGHRPIDGRATEFDPETREHRLFTARFEPDANGLLRAVWLGHKDFSANHLSEISHAPNSPWDQVARGKDLRIHRGVPIPDALLRDHFRTFTAEWGNRGQR
ncbi:MAG: Panacea domain-containing protein [Fimbriiglobus sp.]